MNGLCMSRLHLQLWIPTLLMLPRTVQRFFGRDSRRVKELAG
uniref:Uncharacterized protein n=1 Tax=Lotus japonicus TaxID=34305 RepID=I3SZY6_LOTJA|nr:unknown [Lotus japonicus]